jgi:IS1 family transposase
MGFGSARFENLSKKQSIWRIVIFFLTDARDAFAEAFPFERHIIEKAHTISIERNNGNTRHFLGRFTRRTKVVSKRVEMVSLSLRLCMEAVFYGDWFHEVRGAILSRVE